MTRKVSFPGDRFPPLDLPEGANLSLHLTAENSPVLFGCRTGLCGTCAAGVEVLAGSLEPADEEETETLEVAFDFTPPRAARLLCQVRLSADVRITPIDKGVTRSRP